MRCAVIGPRGGISHDEVSCYTCISGTTCQLTRFKDLGCDDWVSEDGQRRIAPLFFPPAIDSLIAPILDAKSADPARIIERKEGA